MNSETPIPTLTAPSTDQPDEYTAFQEAMKTFGGPDDGAFHHVDEGALYWLWGQAAKWAGAMKRESSFQQRVEPWMLECFGPEIAGDTDERNHRFIEEALELVQACGATASECHQLVNYVFNRPVGEPHQESGGVMVTHATLCLANGLDMHHNGETELARIWGKVEQIRAKQAAKPKHSPLPIRNEIEDERT